MKKILLSTIFFGLALTFCFPHLTQAQEDTGIFPIAIITPKILEFPNTRVGTTSAELTVTISKTNSRKPLKIFRIFNHTPNLFPITEDNCTNVLLFNGETCTIKFAFSPGRERHYFSFYTVINSGINFVAFGGLKGRGVEPEMMLSDDEIDFGDHPVGSPSNPHAVLLKNVGTGALDVTNISSDNSVFTQTNDCIGTPIDPGDFCTISVTFTPDATGGFQGTITIVGDAPNSPQLLDLTGTGVTPDSAALSVDKSALGFGNQIVNTTSGTQMVTVTNTGNGPDLDITTVNVPAPFGLMNDNCSNTILGQGFSCTFEVDFTPTSEGNVDVKLTFTVVQVITTPTIDLSGNGISPNPPNAELSQDEVDFGEQAAETSSSLVTVTMTNIGGAPITGGTLTLGGTNPEAFSVNDDCSGVVIQVGESCSIEIRFHPSQDGSFSATITIENNAADSPLIIRLQGIGIGGEVGGGGGCSFGGKATPPTPMLFLTLLGLGGMLLWRKFEPQKGKFKH